MVWPVYGSESDTKSRLTNSTIHRSYPKAYFGGKKIIIWLKKVYHIDYY